MSGIAAEFVKGAPERKKIHLFYNTPSKNLALQARSELERNDSGIVFSSESETDIAHHAGFVLQKSQIASTTYLGINFVFGFTEKPLDEGDEKQPCPSCGNNRHAGSSCVKKNSVSMVSPIYKPLAVTEPENVTIAATASDETAWVYYLTGGKENKRLHECQVDDSTAAEKLDASEIQEKTSLAAFYNNGTQTRHVIFQKTNNRLYEQVVEESGAPIDGTGDAKPGTPMAVACVQSVLDENGTEVVPFKAYLYYVDNGNHIRVVVKTGNTWSSSVRIRNEHRVDNASQITALAAGTRNHLFFKAPGQRDPHHAVVNRD